MTSSFQMTLKGSWTNFSFGLQILRPLHVGFVQATCNCTIRRWLFGEIYCDCSDPTFLLSRLCNLSEGPLSHVAFA